MILCYPYGTIFQVGPLDSVIGYLFCIILLQTKNTHYFTLLSSIFEITMKITIDRFKSAIRKGKQFEYECEYHIHSVWLITLQQLSLQFY